MPRIETKVPSRLHKDINFSNKRCNLPERCVADETASWHLRFTSSDALSFNCSAERGGLSLL